MSAPSSFGSGRRLMLFFGMFFFLIGVFVTVTTILGFDGPGHEIFLEPATIGTWRAPDVRTTVGLIGGIASAAIGALFLAAWAICQTLAERDSLPDPEDEQ